MMSICYTNLNDSVFLRVYRNHGSAVEVEGQLVARMSVAAEEFHLLLDPLHGGRRPNDNVEILNGKVLAQF